MEATLTELKKYLGEQVRSNELLARYTTLKVGGPADFFYEAKTREDLKKAIMAARELHLPYFILGGGTNILIGDKGIRGLVIKNNTKNIVLKGMKQAVSHGEQVSEVFVEADSGVMLNQLVRFTADEGLGGLEMHLGLPGTVGGAVYMNSKWMHPEGYVGDPVYQATILLPDGTETTVPKSYFHFAYDYSVLQKTHETILGVVFALHKADKTKVWETANDSIAYRRKSQPQGVKTAGCTFRNISQAQAMNISTPGYTTSAGYLIDQAGLKGLTEGKACISPLHANFIMNMGGATAADIVALIEKARASVKAKFGVELEEEVERIGEF